MNEEDSKHISDVHSLRKHVKALEKKSNSNLEQRIAHAETPSKFVQSEVDLNSELQIFEALGAHQELLPEFKKLGGLDLLISLIGHANSDIGLEVISILVDITATDFWEDVIENYDLPLLFFSLLNGLDPSQEEDDFKGVSNILQCIDNLIEAVGVKFISELLKTKSLIKWMLNYMVNDESTLSLMDYNKLYVTEILSVVLQTSEEAQALLASDPEVIDSFLVALNQFRKKDEVSSEELEFIYNIVNCLRCLLMEESARTFFTKAQGVQLMVRFLKAGNHVKGILQVLSTVLIYSKESANLFVELGGLGLAFPLIGVKYDELVASIVLSLCRNCTGDHITRVIGKFFEHNCEKLKRLTGLHRLYLSKVAEAEEELRLESEWKQPLKDYSKSLVENSTVEDANAIALDEMAYMERSEAGLTVLQLVDQILLWCTLLGTEILTLQVHLLLSAPVSEEKKDYKMIDSFCEVLREFVDHITSEEKDAQELRRVLNERLEQLVSGHSIALEKVNNLVTENEVALKNQRLAANKQAAINKSRKRRLKREEERERNKLRKMDRQLERREAIEQRRFDRKVLS